MNAILEAAQLQGQASISRKAWVSRGATKVHLWELSSGGVILLKHSKGQGFDHPIKLEEPMEVVVNRFRDKRGHRVFSPIGSPFFFVCTLPGSLVLVSSTPLEFSSRFTLKNSSGAIPSRLDLSVIACAMFTKRLNRVCDQASDSSCM
ncbi:hypothetical protein [Pseudomonas sp. 2FE]|uniref:hypothetical protein n=1 Tax=Pseudomonas sp. 2FE TaxID=2502190 RepID=UPI00148517CD|nr:hypothetical protein [Pseudomonas sp. 2FE]